MFAMLSPVTDTFETTNLGSTLILKACGFVEEHRARIINVREGHLKLRIGHSWLERLFIKSCEPVDVVLNITEHDHNAPDSDSRVPRSSVQVSIRPKSMNLTRDQFAELSRKILWSLRYHFIAR